MNTQLITRREFDDLKNYSCSIPTLTTVGKRWKRAKEYSRQTDNPRDWILCEYVELDPPNPDRVGIRYSQIAIASEDEELIMSRLYSRS